MAAAAAAAALTMSSANGPKYGPFVAAHSSASLLSFPAHSRAFRVWTEKGAVARRLHPEGAAPTASVGVRPARPRFLVQSGIDVLPHHVLDTLIEAVVNRLEGGARRELGVSSKR